LKWSEAHLETQFLKKNPFHELSTFKISGEKLNQGIRDELN